MRGQLVTDNIVPILVVLDWKFTKNRLKKGKDDHYLLTRRNLSVFTRNNCALAELIHF